MDRTRVARVDLLVAMAARPGSDVEVEVGDEQRLQALEPRLQLFVEVAVRAEAADEARVGDAVLARRGVDPGDPEPSEVTLPDPTIPVRVRPSALDGVLRRPVQLGAPAELPAAPLRTPVESVGSQPSIRMGSGPVEFRLPSSLKIRL